MKRNPIKTAVLIAALAMCAGVTAQATVVDSLTTGSMSLYTETIILAQNADSDFTFSSSGSGLQVSRVYTSGNTPQQDVLLRNDFHLTVGNELRVAISGLGTASANADFGIAIASQVNPNPAVYTGANVDARSNYLSMYVKPGSSQVGTAAFNGTTQLTYTGSGSVTPPGGSYSTIDGLWIAETAFNVFSIGYTTTGSGDVTQASGLTFTGADIGNSIGFYADLRATETSPAIFSNLQIVSIPEPSTLAMCGMGLAGLLALKRRK